jgi:4-hydroxyproline epimerase
MQRIPVIDSHTGGEPTRVVIDGIPDLGSGSVADRARVFAQRFDHFRSCVVNEPRGSDVLVGALLLPPSDPRHAAAVIFFNNAGVLGMCGHGTIGLMVTLHHLGRIPPGTHTLETPVGLVQATLHDAHRASVRNVPSYRQAKGVEVRLPSGEAVRGDVAWGGNWFYLVSDHGQELSLRRVDELTSFTWAIRQQLAGYPVEGVVDHIELFGPPGDAQNHSRNFVLCPGKAYDRSPCGTGTSAKLACLAADGKLAPGATWRQESILGSVFEANYELAEEGRIIPTIAGTAFVTAESTLLVDPADPFRDGIRS